MKRIFSVVLPIIISLFYTNARAQSGLISGTVSDADNSEPLIGATVALNGTSLGAVTDIDGNFTIANVPASSYILHASYVGYEAKDVSGIEVKQGQTISINITIGVAQANTLQEVLVTADLKKENIASILLARKNSAVVSDAISSDMIRKSPDKSTSDVLKRVSGVTVQDNKFVVVRGMNDRYNSAILNGSVLPSSEPDRKTFAFDIFPAAMVDNITIIKSMTPDLPGDFSGGLVQINTKDIPDEGFISVKAGTGYNSLGTFNPYYKYEGGKTDWLGFDDGTRALPSGFPSHAEFLQLSDEEQVLAGQSLSNTWALQPQNSMPLNSQVQLAAGFNSGQGKFPVVGGNLALTYNDTRKFTPIHRYDYYGISDAMSDTIYHYVDSSYTRNILSSVLGGLSVKLNANNKFYFNNIFSINSTDQTTLRSGYNWSQQYFIKANSYFFSSNQIFNSQFGAEHFIPSAKVKIKWQYYYTFLHRDEPDYRRNIYQNDDTVINEYFSPLSSATSTNVSSGLRYFGAIDDEAKGINLEAGWQFKLFKQAQNLKAGGSFYYDKRTRDVRVFSPSIASPGEFDFSLYYASQDTLFDPFHFNTTTGFILIEDNTPTNHYDGTIDNTAAFVMLDNRFTEKLRFVWGLRVEDYHYVLNTFDSNNDSLRLDSTYLDLLPSANLIFSVLKNANLRMSFSRTVARPSYRELANAPFYDFLQNITYYGNSNLVVTKINNYEIRWEQYFDNAQYYSISGFYKQFENPIEQNLFLPGADSRSIIFVNVPEATNLGFEIEARKNFSFLGKQFENFYLYGNFSYIKSKVFVRGTTSDTTANRPLEGQSPYVFNASLQYQEPKHNIGVSLMYNYIGHRLFLVGSVSDPAVWQKVHPTLDLKVTKSFLKNGLVEITWSDILHGDDTWYEDHNANETYNEPVSNNYELLDRLVQSQSFGYNLSLAVSYRF